MKRVVLLVIDGWGVGAQEDAEKYGDQSAHTMGHVSEITMLKLPNFQKMVIFLWKNFGAGYYW